MLKEFVAKRIGRPHPPVEKVKEEDGRAAATQSQHQEQSRPAPAQSEQPQPEQPQPAQPQPAQQEEVLETRAQRIERGRQIMRRVENWRWAVYRAMKEDEM